MNKNRLNPNPNQRSNIAGLKTLRLIGFSLLSVKEGTSQGTENLIGKFFKKSFRWIQGLAFHSNSGTPLSDDISTISDAWYSSNDRFESVETFWLKFSIISESLLLFIDSKQFHWVHQYLHQNPRLESVQDLNFRLGIQTKIQHLKRSIIFFFMSHRNWQKLGTI